MAYVFIKSLYLIFLNYRINHIFWHKIMHMLGPKFVNFIVRQVAIIFESLSFFYCVILQYFIHNSLIFHLISIFRFSTSVPLPSWLRLFAGRRSSTLFFGWLFLLISSRIYFPFLLNLVFFVCFLSPSAPWLFLFSLKWPPTCERGHSKECHQKDNT